MPARALFCLIFLSLIVPLQGQDDGPVRMTPEFPFVFPLTKNGHDVMVKYPILISPTVVLQPGMVLRTLYVLTDSNIDGSSDLVLAHHGNMEQSYSRETPSSSDADKMPPELAHEIEGYRRTVWEVPQNFVMAMAQYPTAAMHLIYCPGSDNRDLHDERFSFFDGLFVGLPSGKVTVLAVEKESKAEAAGLLAGDEIAAVGGISTRNDLATFAAAYATAKKTAKENEVSTYSMTVHSAGATGQRTVAIAMPASFKGGLMDGF